MVGWLNVADYNYEVFDMEREQPPFARFKTTLPVGTRATSFPLEDLTSGETVALADAWRQGFAVVEFGSFT